MASLTLAIIFLLSCGCQRIYGNEDCGDCIPFANCLEAVKLVNVDKSPEVKQLVKNAFCGFKYRRGQKTIKVCCSEFKNIQIPTPAPYTDSVESHRNVHLLARSCENLDNKRIFHGEVAAMYELPFMVLLAYTTGTGVEFMCGGSIISSRYVLTAAHCIRRQQLVAVRVGEYDVRYKTDCDADLVCESHIEDIDVDDIVVHKKYQYSASRVVHDIALLRLKTEIDFSYNNVAPVCLPIARELRQPLVDGEVGLVAGWGMTETHAPSPFLMKVNIPVLTDVTCREVYNKHRKPGHKYQIENEFCAGELNKDSCSGDSGGPFVLERLYNDTTSHFQYGIVSRGPRQCGTTYPGIYTNVIDHMGWILDNIRP